MIRIVNHQNPDFITLSKLLDKELTIRYPLTQDDNIPHNQLNIDDKIFILYIENYPIACGALKIHTNHTVEMKRVFIKTEYRQMGYSKLLVDYIEQWVIKNEYKQIILETGIMQPEAIKFYKKYKYKIITNYGPYKDNKNSICMEKLL